VLPQVAVPISEVLAAEAPVIAAQVEQNAPQILTAGAGAGGAAAAAGWSWTAILTGTAVVILVLAGGYVLYKQATSSSSPSPSVEASPQPVGALPDPGLTGETPDAPPPVQTPLPTPLPTVDAQAPETQTPEPQAPSPTPVAQPEPVPAPAQAPPPSPSPTPTPTPCALPNSIGVTGGDHSSLGPSGGSFTVTSTPVVLSASAVDCGDPYKMSFGASRPGGGTVSGASCSPHGDISYNISSGPNPVQVGDSVSVTLEAPPNSC
jgi:hypothetical protein